MRHGSPFEVFYYLAKIQVAQIKIVPASLKPGACSIATTFFKVVAASERGPWGSNLIQERGEAWETGTPSGKQPAMLNGGLPLSVGLRPVKAIWRSFSTKLGR